MDLIEMVTVSDARFISSFQAPPALNTSHRLQIGHPPEDPYWAPHHVTLVAKLASRLLWLLNTPVISNLC